MRELIYSQLYISEFYCLIFKINPCTIMMYIV